jgi:hypothetical protein
VMIGYYLWHRLSSCPSPLSSSCSAGSVRDVHDVHTVRQTCFCLFRQRSVWPCDVCVRPTSFLLVPMQ